MNIYEQLFPRHEVHSLELLYRHAWAMECRKLPHNNREAVGFAGASRRDAI